MPDVSTKKRELTAQEAQEKAEATEAELLQVLNRGAVTDRLDVKDGDPNRHYEWPRDEEAQIMRWQALGFVCDTEDGKEPSGLHGTGDNRIRVGDAIRMSCTMDRFKTLEKLKAQRKEKRRKMNAKKEYVQRARQKNPSVPVIDPLNVGGSED